MSKLRDMFKKAIDIISKNPKLDKAMSGKPEETKEEDIKKGVDSVPPKEQKELTDAMGVKGLIELIKKLLGLVKGGQPGMGLPADQVADNYARSFANSLKGKNEDLDKYAEKHGVKDDPKENLKMLQKLAPEHKTTQLLTKLDKIKNDENFKDAMNSGNGYRQFKAMAGAIKEVGLKNARTMMKVAAGEMSIEKAADMKGLIAAAGKKAREELNKEAKNEAAAKASADAIAKRAAPAPEKPKPENQQKETSETSKTAAADEKGEKKSEATEEQSATKSNDAQKTEQTASPAPEKTSLGNNNRVPSTPIPDKEKKRIAEGISGMLIAEGHALEALKKTAKQEEITPENTNTGRPSGPPSL